MIATRDMRLLRAFITREALDFKFKDTADRLEYINRMMNSILSYDSAPSACDFLVIISSTSLGQTERELHLTPKNWDSSGGNTTVLLPPAPKGSINVTGSPS